MAPLWSPVVIYDNPTTRNTFAPHCTYTIYIAPSMLHYHNRKYWVPSIHKMRISRSARIYPEHWKIKAIIKNTQDAREAPTTTPTVSTSTDAISLRVIQKTPIIHQQRTLRNTPMTTIHEVNDPNQENNTQQQSHPTKPTSLVPNQRRCQPPRVSKKRTVDGQLIGSKRNDVKIHNKRESNH